MSSVKVYNLWSVTPKYSLGLKGMFAGSWKTRHDAINFCNEINKRRELNNHKKILILEIPRENLKNYNLPETFYVIEAVNTHS